MTEKRYRLKHNKIIDTYTNKELTSEEILNRLNYEYKMHHKYKTETEHILNTIDNAIQTERTQIGQNVLKQLAGSIGVKI